MADGFDVDVDATALLAMFDRVGPSLEFHLRDVARLTATRIVTEAKARVHRATGETGEGIHYDTTKDEKGYMVFGYEQGRQENPVDLYLEHGTMYMLAHPFFFSAAAIENGPHLRRTSDRIEQVLADLGR